jgi:hypothetical protein
MSHTSHRPYRTLKQTLAVLLALAAALSTGCAEFVGTAARSSLASFLNSIVSTAITETVGP